MCLSLCATSCLLWLLVALVNQPCDPDKHRSAAPSSARTLRSYASILSCRLCEAKQQLSFSWRICTCSGTSTSSHVGMQLCSFAGMSVCKSQSAGVQVSTTREPHMYRSNCADVRNSRQADLPGISLHTRTLADTHMQFRLAIQTCMTAWNRSSSRPPSKYWQV